MIRRLGRAVLGAGVLVLAWVAVTSIWGDPVTSLYTRHQQRALASRLDAVNERWSAVPVNNRDGGSSQTKAARKVRSVRAAAGSYRRTLRDGEPLGRIVIPRLGVRMVVVQGTSRNDLKKGPGHYNSRSGRNTGLPGMGGVIGIAGHRTTYSHPFRHIDDLRPGDRIELQMPYGRFVYTVFHHRIADDQDWSILRRRPFEKLVLTACHPLYSAKQRWVVFARLTSEQPV
jgi:sortase A